MPEQINLFNLLNIFTEATVSVSSMVATPLIAQCSYLSSYPLPHCCIDRGSGAQIGLHEKIDIYSNRTVGWIIRLTDYSIRVYKSYFAK